jgi:glycosyltransferase involved in cell wall biosynthesis
MIKVAICLSHFIQYKVPLLRKLAEHPGLDIHVYYYSDMGLVEKKSREHGKTFIWDTPLKEGYQYSILKNLLDDDNWRFRLISPYLNPKIVCEILNKKYDVIIIHSYQYPSDWLAFLTTKIIRKKVLFYGELYPVHNISTFRKVYRRIIHQTMINHIDACLAIGTLAKEVYLDEFNVPPHKVFLAPYSVENNYFQAECLKWRQKKDKVKEELGIFPGELIVLCVARMVVKKRHEDLILAMSQQKEKTRLILVGYGPRFNDIVSFSQEYLPSTLLTGFINQKELPKYYAIADVFVLPSEFDEFGLVVNEAMNSGLPVIASRGVAAAHDLIIEGQNGFTFDPGDISTLSVEINLLLINEELREKFGKASLEIINNWSITQTVNGITEAINYVTKKEKYQK